MPKKNYQLVLDIELFTSLRLLESGEERCIGCGLCEKIVYQTVLEWRQELMKISRKGFFNIQLIWEDVYFLWILQKFVQNLQLFMVEDMKMQVNKEHISHLKRYFNITKMV